MNDELLDRITTHTGRRNPIETLVPQPCFILGKGKNEYPSSLQLVLEQGKIIEAIPYAHIQHIHYNLAKGIILSLVGSTIVIYGKHLDTLFNVLIEQRISQIIPATEPIPMNTQDNDTSLVTRIEVTYHNPQVQKNIDAM